MPYISQLTLQSSLCGIPEDVMDDGMGNYMKCKLNVDSPECQ